MAILKDQIGIFRGFGDPRYEVLSEVLLPYQGVRMPLQGGFVVIGLEHTAPGGPECAILGRVIRAYPQGDLLSEPGEDYLVDIMRLKQSVPEQVRQSRLRYRMSVRLLGQMVEEAPGRIQFTPSVRMMPHVGSPVGFPTDEVYAMIARGTCRADDLEPTNAPVIGHLAFGDLVFDGNERNARGRTFPVRFGTDALIGRRIRVRQCLGDRSAGRARCGAANDRLHRPPRLRHALCGRGEGRLPDQLLRTPAGGSRGSCRGGGKTGDGVRQHAAGL